MDSSKFQMTTIEEQCKEYKYMLKLMPSATLHQFIKAKDFVRLFHIVCLTSDKVWTSGYSEIVLINTSGAILHRIKDACSSLISGPHTVNHAAELIYIDKLYNINKLSNDMKTVTTFIKSTGHNWRPQCMHCSALTGDLLVGLKKYDSESFIKTRKNLNEQLLQDVPRDHTGKELYRTSSGIGKVLRYNQFGQLTQIIQHDTRGWKIYRHPSYITENNNGDVVVSDSDWPGAVFVTNSDGKIRFVYTGHPAGPGLKPWGVCTDALLHILVCDGNTHTVQMINSDGQFLSHLLIRPLGILSPCSLAYDFNTHRLWVGPTDKINMCIYSYITQQQVNVEVQQQTTTDHDEDDVSIAIKRLEKPHEEFENLREQKYETDLIQSLILESVNSCNHIACVTPNTLWVCDNKDNLTLIHINGDVLYEIKERERGFLRQGLHTVNGQGELIYIDKFYDINKLSNNMLTITTFIGRRDREGQPWCLYWSPFSGDLLVVIWGGSWESKVARYNKSGHLIHTTQYDDKGLDIYFRPDYITENTNGEVVVSDHGAVVVTSREGKYRFSYTGHPPLSGFEPKGICTDELSHILVCDDKTNTVQILDKNGQFLSNLLSKQSWIRSPSCLCYDVKTHCLWIGSCSNNRLNVFRYKTKFINKNAESGDNLRGQSNVDNDGHPINTSAENSPILAGTLRSHDEVTEQSNLRHSDILDTLTALKEDLKEKVRQLPGESCRQLILQLCKKNSSVVYGALRALTNHISRQEEQHTTEGDTSSHMDNVSAMSADC